MQVIERKKERMFRVPVEDIAGVGDGACRSGYCGSCTRYACGRRAARGNPRQPAGRTRDGAQIRPPHTPRVLR